MEKLRATTLEMKNELTGHIPHLMGLGVEMADRIISLKGVVEDYYPGMGYNRREAFEKARSEMRFFDRLYRGLIENARKELNALGSDYRETNEAIFKEVLKEK